MTWNRLYRRPASATLVKFGVSMGPPNVLALPKPASSMSTSSTLGAPSGAWTCPRMSQSATDPSKVRFWVPLNTGSAIGSFVRSRSAIVFRPLAMSTAPRRRVEVGSVCDPDGHAVAHRQYLTYPDTGSRQEAPSVAFEVPWTDGLPRFLAPKLAQGLVGSPLAKPFRPLGPVPGSRTPIRHYPRDASTGARSVEIDGAGPEAGRQALELESIRRIPKPPGTTPADTHPPIALNFVDDMSPVGMRSSKSHQVSALPIRLKTKHSSTETFQMAGWRPST